MFRITLFALLLLPAISLGDERPVDAFGDALPEGAVMRLDTRRFRIQPPPNGHFLSLQDGRTWLISHRRPNESQEEIRWMDVGSGKVVDTWVLPKAQSICGFSPDMGRRRCALTALQFGPANSTGDAHLFRAKLAGFSSRFLCLTDRNNSICKRL